MGCIGLILVFGTAQILTHRLGLPEWLGFTLACVAVCGLVWLAAWGQSEMTAWGVRKGNHDA